MKTHQVPLHKIAITRSGDKGDISNIGVIALSSDIYALLKERLTPERVKDYFKDVVLGDVVIYPMDNIEALQIVMHRALGGGATRTLRFDQTGKSMSVLVQSLEVPFGDNELALVPERPPFEAPGQA